MTYKFQEVNLTRLHAYFYIVLGHIALFYLLFTLQWQMLLLSLVMQFFIVHLGISMTYHRSISHNSIKLPKWLEVIGLIFGGLSFQGSAISWAAVHRQHHKANGTDKDPHSPKYLGSWTIHIFGYAFRKIDPRNVVKLLKTDLLFWHTYYYYIFVPFLIVPFFFMDFNTVLALFYVPIALVFQIINFVNTWTHSWDEDIAADVPVTWIILGGEAWHKVHHDNPGQLILHKYDWLGHLLAKLNNK